MLVLPSHRNQSVDLLCKSIDWLLYVAFNELIHPNKWIKILHFLDYNFIILSANYFCSGNIRLRYVVHCAIWYHLNNLKTWKAPMEECYLYRSFRLKPASNFTKSNTLPWVLFTFFKLYIYYQVVQRISYVAN